MNSNPSVTIEVNVEIKISIWNLLKLRLCGKKLRKILMPALLKINKIER